MVAPKGPKPKKPYKDFPLFPHAAGMWAKKIRGKLHYFGPWGDPDGSLNKYRLQGDDLQAGRKPREYRTDGVTIVALAQQFLLEKKGRMDEGTLSPHMMSDYQKTCRMLVKHFGENRRVDDLRPDDFRELRAAIQQGPRGKRGVVAIANWIRMTRVVFKYAADNELIERPLNFGTAFKLPTKAELRKARHQRALRQFSAEEIRSLIAAATIPMKAMILLAINAALGNRDCAMLPTSAVSFTTGWLIYPRGKSGVPRRAKLWPETLKAIRAALEKRPRAKDGVDFGLLFITQRGQSWVRSRQQLIPDGDGQRLKITFADSIIQEFVKLLVKVGIDRDNTNFYGLRHTFMTVADEVRDKPAVDLIMGHAESGIDSHYRERIDDSRLDKIADHVHRWLFRKTTHRKTRAK